MSGQNNSVYSRLKKLVPNLFYTKCLSHTAHLIAARACKCLPKHEALFITKIAAYFGHSNKKLANFKDIQEIFMTPLNKILSSASTRWLSHEACIKRLLEQWEPLQAFFLIEYNENIGKTGKIAVDCRDKAKFILDHLNSRTTYCYLLFLTIYLKEIIVFNLIFQSDGCEVYKIFSASRELFKIFALKCLNLNFMKNNYENLKLLDFSIESNLKEVTLFDLDVAVEKYIVKNFNMQNKNDYEAVLLIRRNCLNFCICVCKEILNRLPIFDKSFDFC